MTIKQIIVKYGREGVRKMQDKEEVMQKKSRGADAILKVLSKLAVKNANIACSGFMYEPAVPNELKQK